MRALLILVWLAAWPSLAQAPAGPTSTTCNIVTGSPDLNEAGELARPAPTDEQCARVFSLEAKFLATSPRDFRLVRNMTRLPAPVRIYVEGIGGLSESRGPVNVQVGRSDHQTPSTAVWIGTELVVLAYRVSDLSGTSTTVVLADLDSLTACAYLRWRGGELPGNLSINEIQRALDRGRLGEREVPACNLRLLPLD